MALAQLRRMLLEMGHELSPAAMGGEQRKVGSLELWLHAPHAALDGSTPLQALQEVNGQDLVRPLLEALVQASAAARGEAGKQAGDAGAGEPGAGA